jgi:RNA polymerase sigma-70 factor (ECF subfamily)
VETEGQVADRLEAPEPVAAFSAEGEEIAELRAVLRRAVAKVCPPWLADRRDDLIQGALVRILEIQRKSEGKRAFRSSYLYKVAYSALIDEIRRVRRRREVAMDETTEAPSRHAVPTGEDPEKAAFGVEIQRGVRICLAGLAPDRRRAVTLHLLGHSVAEAARILDWAFKRTENLVYRGMSDLRACLEARGLKP